MSEEQEGAGGVTSGTEESLRLQSSCIGPHKQAVSYLCLILEIVLTASCPALTRLPPHCTEPRTLSGRQQLPPPATPCAPPSPCTTWRAKCSPRCWSPPSDPRRGTRSVRRSRALGLPGSSSFHQVLMREIRENHFLGQVIKIVWDLLRDKQCQQFYPLPPHPPSLVQLNPSRHSRRSGDSPRYQRMLSSWNVHNWQDNGPVSPNYFILKFSKMYSELKL